MAHSVDRCNNIYIVALDCSIEQNMYENMNLNRVIICMTSRNPLLSAIVRECVGGIV